MKLLKIALVLAATGTLALPSAAHAGQLVWRGAVDDQATITLHGRDVQTNTVSGKAVENADSQVSGRLPTERPAFVSLDGRGTLRVVQQPRPSNNFTAVVRVHDPQPGAGRYRFRLNW